MVENSDHDTLYADVKKFIQQSSIKDFNMGTVTILTRYAMSLVQKHKVFKKMKGCEKRELVSEVVSEVISDFLKDESIIDMSDDVRTGVLVAIEFIPILIDTAVAFAKTYRDSKHNFLCC